MLYVFIADPSPAQVRGRPKYSTVQNFKGRKSNSMMNLYGKRDVTSHQCCYSCSLVSWHVTLYLVLVHSNCFFYLLEPFLFEFYEKYKRNECNKFVNNLPGIYVYVHVERNILFVMVLYYRRYKNMACI